MYLCNYFMQNLSIPNNMNKKELVEKINSLDALTVEEKSALIDLLKQKKYGLVWENKPEDVEERLRAELPVLKEVTDKALQASR